MTKYELEEIRDLLICLRGKAFTDLLTEKVGKSLEVVERELEIKYIENSYDKTRPPIKET